MVPTATNFATPAQPRLLHELRAHHQVVVEEPAGVLAVGADAADHRREMDDDVGPRVVQQAHDVRLVGAGRTRGCAARRAAGSRAARAHRPRSAPRKPAPPVTTTRLPAQNSAIGATAPFSAAAAVEVGVDHHPHELGELTLGSQPSFSRALLASPSSRSTSAGREASGR